MIINWSLDCVLSRLTGFGAGWEGAQILAEARNFSPKLPHQLRDLPSFLFHGYQGSYPGVKWPGHEGAAYLHLVVGIRMDGAVSLLPQ